MILITSKYGKIFPPKTAVMSHDPFKDNCLGGAAGVLHLFFVGHGNV